MSRGFVICAILALMISLLFCFRSSNVSQVRARSSTLSISLKIFAVCALLTTTLLQIPEGIQHNLLIGNFEGVTFATGVDTSVVSCFFYAGVLAFADGMFPLKVSAIASSHHRSDLPLVFATACGGLTRWIFCFLASTVLMNKDYIPDSNLTPSFVLIGVSIYLLIIVLPEIIDG